MSDDFESVDFNPSAALAAIGLSLPCDDVQPLNSLSEYENSVRRKTTTTTKTTAEKPQLSKRKKAALRASLAPQYFTSHQPKRRVKNVLTIMEEIEGPLAKLRQCMKDKTPIKVWTRSAKEMRGVCSGYLQAFDRHWNLILSDVDETYVFPKKIKDVPEAREQNRDIRNVSSEGTSNEARVSTADKPSEGFTEIKRTRKNRADLRQRHVRQMFIRGDNVAFVSIKDF